jgi:general stress protein 26
MGHMTHEDKLKKLRELMKDIDFCMLTTVSEDGTLLSRPMSTQEVEFDGDLWFFTADNTGKADDIRRERQVNVSYALPDKHRFVSVSGLATLVNDRAKMKELWSPVYKVYFPEGLEDPDLRLIKVHVQQAEYWESEGLIPTLISFAQGLMGKETEMGENEKIKLAP